MWYNELLLVLMAFLIVLMIVMAIMVASQRRNRAKKPEKIEEEEKLEKILVEKGFEGMKDEPIEKHDEEFNEPIYEPVIVEEKPEELVYEEPDPVYEEPIPVQPIYEPEPVIEPVYEEKPEEYIEPEVEPEPVIDESIEITPIEPIIIENEYKPEYGKINGDVPEEPALKEEPPEPEYVEPVIYEIPDVEPDESVLITPNQTFYDPVLEETKETPIIDKSPVLEEEVIEPKETPFEDIPEIELPPLEPYEPTSVPEEIEPDIEEEPIPEPMVKPQLTRKPRSRIRKPVIDESDPSLRIDLGVNTCPHCGSKVPDTIYCIYCGKSLNSNNTVKENDEEV